MVRKLQLELLEAGVQIDEGFLLKGRSFIPRHLSIAQRIGQGKASIDAESIYDAQTLVPTTGEFLEGWGRVPGGMITKISEQIF